jgi:hypothetical protein
MSDHTVPICTFVHTAVCIQAVREVRRRKGAADTEQAVRLQLQEELLCLR